MALDADELKTLLAKIDARLRRPGTICLIGSAATILLGQVSRQTDDIDVWADASQIGLDELRLAAEAAGLASDPKDEFPDLPYIQIVHPGLVQVPGWNAAQHAWFGEPEREVWKGRKLTVTVPSPRAIIASNLVRGDDRDLEDCLWLIVAHGVEAREIVQAVSQPRGIARRKAKDNSIFSG